MSIEKHPFEPFLPPEAHILFLGSFPPQPHRWSIPFYYPNWINDFWRILGLIHFCDKDHFCIPGEKRFDEAAIRAFCTQAGLAFYDTACEVRRLRDNASDAFLEVVTPTDVMALLARIPRCDTLVTTGQKAAETIAATFGCSTPPIGGCIDISVGGCSSITIGGSADTAAGSCSDSVAAGGSDNAAGSSSDNAAGGCSDNVAGCCSDNAARPIRFWRMPSTSRAYPLPLEQKAAAYRRLFL